MQLVAPFYPSRPFSEHAPSAPPLKHFEGRKRLAKDTLRSGRFVIGYTPEGEPRYRDFTPAELTHLAQRHQEMLDAGLVTKLCWDHPEKGPFPDAQDCIADIAEVWADNESLYFSVYVPESTERALTNQTWPNSPGIVWDFRDGSGKVWPGPSLVHIACVAHATVPAQQPFLEMGTQSPTTKRKPMDLEALLTEINRLYDAVKPGTALPTEGDNATTEENLVNNMNLLNSAILGAPEDAPEEEEAPPLEEPPAEDPLMMSLKTLITEQFAAVNARFDAIEGERTKTAKESFETELESLCEAGSVLPKYRDTLLTLGLKTQWDLSVLEPHRDAQAIDRGSKTRAAKSAKEPATGKRFSETESAEADRLLGIKPKK